MFEASSVSRKDSSPRDASISNVVADDDQRWAAWQARGAAHERAVRRRMTIAVPFVVAAAAIVYLLLLR